MANLLSAQSTDYRWPFWPVLPLYPYGQRRTLRQTVVPEQIWTFEQLQGIFYVVTPIRMTVIALKAGGLLVYAPVAPTPECVRLMRELEADHGPVRYILLPTASGLEHKVFVGPFARCFPTATVFVAPHQWSFPVNLPLRWLGLPGRRTQRIPGDWEQFPFADEFEFACLGPINLGLGIFEEIALFHRTSQTLLLTDTLISLPLEPPTILQADPYPLLFHAREEAADWVMDSPAARRKGWWRIALFGCYFRPSSLAVLGTGPTLRAAGMAGDRSAQAYFGLYPFAWQPGWEDSFHALRGGGRLFVAPVLQRLILNRQPELVLDWADRVMRWPFRRVIPCHYEAPLAIAPREFRAAFTFLEADPAPIFQLASEVGFPVADMALLERISRILERGRITPPARGKV
jgi:hypothetical protein